VSVSSAAQVGIVDAPSSRNRRNRSGGEAPLALGEEGTATSPAGYRSIRYEHSGDVD